MVCDNTLTVNPGKQYAAFRLEGWGPHTQPRPTVICGAGPERPRDAETIECLRVAPEPHTTFRGDVSSDLRAPLPPSLCYTPPTYSGPRRYVHEGDTQPPSGGAPRRRGAPGAPWPIPKKGGQGTMTPCPGWVTFQVLYSSCSPPASPPRCAGS